MNNASVTSPDQTEPWTGLVDGPKPTQATLPAGSAGMEILGPTDNTSLLYGLIRGSLYYRIGDAIHTYYQIVVITLGLVGNTLSLLVMLQQQNRRISCCVYMAALAASDNCVLLIGFYFWLLPIVDRDMFLWECKFTNYAFLAFTTLGICLILAMTLDRFLAIRHPFRTTRWRQSKWAWRFSFIIFLFCLVYAVPFIFTITLSGRYLCLAFSGNNTLERVLSWVIICTSSLIPFIIMLILNSMIIHTIRHRHSYFRRSQSLSCPQELALRSVSGGVAQRARAGTSSRLQSKATQQQLTVTLLAVSFAFLFLVLPQYVRYLVYSFVDNTSSVDTFDVYALVFHVTNKLYITNNCVNFLLYCICGSKFRKDVKDMFLWTCHKGPTSSSNSNSPQTMRTHI